MSEMMMPSMGEAPKAQIPEKKAETPHVLFSKLQELAGEAKSMKVKSALGDTAFKLMRTAGEEAMPAAEEFRGEDVDAKDSAEEMMNIVEQLGALGQGQSPEVTTMIDDAAFRIKRMIEQ